MAGATKDAKPGAKKIETAKTTIGRATASRFPVVFSVLCALVVAGGYWTNAFEWLDFRHSDIIFRQRGLQPADPRVSLVVLDDESSKVIGQFPWPRHIYSNLIDNLMKAGVRVVALDVMFIDPSRPDEDASLIAATKRWGERVVHAATTNPNVVNEYSQVLPFPGLLKATKSLGQVTVPMKDPDGSIRTEPILLGSALRWHRADWASDKNAMPTLGAKALSVYLGQDAREFLKKDYLIDGILLRLNYRGEDRVKQGTIVVNGQAEDVELMRYGVPRIPAWQVLKGEVSQADKERLKGGIVFIGSTALGYFDSFPSPFTSADPGVLVHATLVDNLLNDRGIRQLSNVGTTLLIPLLAALAFFIGRLTPKAAGLSFVGALLAMLGLHYYLFLKLYYVEFMAPLVAYVATFGALLVHKTIEENRKASEIRGMFGQYVAPEVVEILVKNPERLSLGGEKRDMTMFFLDIAHFTTISEAMTPENLIQFLNTYLTALTDDILANNGVVDKYIGDCIMAFWNAPLEEKEHRKKACLAAVACVKTIQRLNKEYVDPSMPETPAVRIGLNSGEVVVGNTGSARKLAYTVLGDEVNLASRLEGANKFFGSTLMASEDTYNGGKEVVEGRLLGAVRVVGKNIPIKVYELMARKGELDPAWVKALPLYHAAIAQYEVRKFEEAKAGFQKVLELVPGDKTTKLYFSSCEDYIVIPPPPEWEPVFNLTSK